MACVACQLLVRVQFRQVVAVSGSCCVRECLSSCVGIRLLAQGCIRYRYQSVRWGSCLTVAVTHRTNCELTAMLWPQSQG